MWICSFATAMLLCVTRLCVLDTRIARTHELLTDTNLSTARRRVLGEYMAESMRKRYYHLEFANVTLD